MVAYLKAVKLLIDRFDKFDIRQVSRDQNTQADALAAIGSMFKSEVTTNIPIIHVLSPSVVRGQDAILLLEDETSTGGEPPQEGWTLKYLRWIRDGQVPSDQDPRVFRMKASMFTEVQGMLFRRSLGGPLLRCLEREEALQVMKDLHSGECGNHSGARGLSQKAMRIGYYWPTMRKDTYEFVKTCDACQRHAKILRQPPEFLHPVLSPWPFMQWGMDIVGKLPRAPGGKVYFLAMTDYFSKWIECESYTQITDTHVISFIKRNILCRFGIPSQIICDNGSQFISDKTAAFCERWNITLIKSTPRHPQSNGQAEASNKVIINNLRRKLEERAGRWAEELPFVLWADRTTPKRATGQTPFSLVFGTEAVIPAEQNTPTHRYGCTGTDDNLEAMAHDLDTVDELRDRAAIHLAAQKQLVARSYNKRVNVRRFEIGDLVLRKVFPNTKNKDAGKFAAKWEGPYHISEIANNGAYRLIDLDGKEVPRPWNALHLKLYHI
jgi:hypothetical protein